MHLVRELLQRIGFFLVCHDVSLKLIKLEILLFTNTTTNMKMFIRLFFFKILLVRRNEQLWLNFGLDLRQEEFLRLLGVKFLVVRSINVFVVGLQCSLLAPVSLILILIFVTWLFFYIMYRFLRNVLGFNFVVLFRESWAWRFWINDDCTFIVMQCFFGIEHAGLRNHIWALFRHRAHAVAVVLNHFVNLTVELTSVFARISIICNLFRSFRCIL